MPWSAKAQGLIRDQYASVSAAAAGALPETIAAASEGAERGVDVGALVSRVQARAVLVDQYTAAWQRYCWPVAGVADLRLAPFHVPATEGAVHVDKDHQWHMETAASICAGDDSGVLFTTAHRFVDLTDTGSEPD